MRHHRTYGPILPNALSPVLLVSEELAKWVSADSPFPRFENLPQDNPVTEVWHMQQNFTWPISRFLQCCIWYSSPIGQLTTHLCVCVGGWQHDETPNIPGAESGAEDKESTAAPWLESQQSPGLVHSLTKPFGGIFASLLQSKWSARKQSLLFQNRLRKGKRRPRSWCLRKTLP